MVLGLLASFLLALIVFPAAAFWLWLRPPRMPILPAVVYLLTAAVFCVFGMVPQYDFAFLLAVTLSFPWSFLLISLSTDLRAELGESVLLLGVVANTFLIYTIGTIRKINPR
jgi:hypothetical protein